MREEIIPPYDTDFSDDIRGKMPTFSQSWKRFWQGVSHNLNKVGVGTVAFMAAATPPFGPSTPK